MKKYLAELKSDPFYNLTANIKDASSEEGEEILAEIDSLSDDDLSISSVHQYTFCIRGSKNGKEL